VLLIRIDDLIFFGKNDFLKSKYPMTRRHLIKHSLVAGIAPLIPFPLLADHNPGSLPLTKSQVLGPFYPLDGFNNTTQIPESPPDFDLVDVRTSTGILPRPLGQILHFTGQVLNREGHAIPGATVELWNADANGWYIDPDSVGPSATVRDVNFQGFGSLVSSEQGAFAFRSIRPSPYPLDNEVSRASHLHVIVKVGGVIRLTTQLYFKDELSTWLAQDPIHGLFDPSRPNDLTEITPNLIDVVETLDHEGNVVITGHKNLVIDQPTTTNAEYRSSIENLQISDDRKTVSMNITPGRLVDIEMSHDLKTWVKVASRQSVIYGQIFPGGLPQRAFFRAQTLPIA